jgi:ABC-type uncharacterized transport system auxiliary subunit
MKKPIHLILLCIVLLFASCGGSKSVVNRFYVLEYPSGFSPVMEENLSPFQGSGHIESPVVHQAFATHQIALREDSHEIKYFSFNEWVSRPEQSLNAILWSFFQDFPAFEQGVVAVAGGQDGFGIETHVSRMEVVQVRNDFHARLDVEFRLVDRSDGKILFTHRTGRQEALRQRNLNLFAATISEMFIEELQVFANGMLREVRAR